MLYYYDRCGLLMEAKKRNKKLLYFLTTIIVFMLVFAYSNEQLYRLFCEAIGISISPNNTSYDVKNMVIDESREVKVVFTTEKNRDVPVAFSVEKISFPIHLGKTYLNTYNFKNTTSDTVYFRPIHSVFPSQASNKYTMLECFCFDDMTLFPYEEKSLPMSFFFNPDVDESVERIVMHYQLISREKDDVSIKEELSNVDK
jgi:cytochrome c oxidase assembly protein subunit 11